MPKPKKRKSRRPIARLWRAALARIAPSRTTTRSTPPVKWSEDEILRAVAPVRAGRTLTPEHWPGGARVAACISFDVDNETPSLSRGDLAPSSLSAGAFGALAGLERILRLLDRHDVPASFYIPAVSALLHPEMIPRIVQPGRHEIGVHGWIHEIATKIDDRAEEKRLLTQAIEALTKTTGKRPAGYRAPQWAFSRHTLDLLLEAGFVYDSSLMAMDEPYELIANGAPTGLVELPVDWILDDAPYFVRSGSLPSPEAIFKTYQDEFDLAYEEGTYFMLTLHPHVIGHRSRIVHLDRFIAGLKARPGIWFATAEQIAAHVKASKPRRGV
jgi:peptidoglycan/xylan/chitin deacetylase (PgdA/CDA1 family)